MKNDFPDELSKALLDEDELGLVIRSHLYIENKLEELLSILVPFPKYYDEMKLSYANKVKLVCAMGFDPDFKPMLNALGTIRNKFAHNLSKKIDESMVENLHSVAHDKYRKMLPSLINDLAEGDEKVSSFSDIHPRDQFTTMVITLWVVMDGAVREVKENENRSNQLLDPTWTTPVLKAKSDSQAGQE